MDYRHSFASWTAMVLVLFSAFMPACASTREGVSEKEDPKVSALQGEVSELTRENAATRSTMEDIYARLDTLDSKLDSLETRVQELADRPQPILITPTKAEEKAQPSKAAPKAQSPVAVDGPPSTPPPTGPSMVKKSETIKKKGSAASPKEPSHGDYDKAYAAYLAHRYDEALPLFKAFVEKHPQHHLADNAQYWVGEIYYDTEDFPTAILAFQEVVTKYGNGNKAPDALLKIGFAYIALDDPENARIFLKRVVKNYPFSEAEAMARAKLKELENL
jgi:tol-pal system protein YbgF